MENRNIWNTKDKLWVFLHRKQASLPTYLAVLTHVHLWKQTSHIYPDRFLLSKRPKFPRSASP